VATQALDDFQRQNQIRQTEQQKREVDYERRKKILNWAAIGVIVICMVGVAYQAPAIMRAARKPQPTRIGTYATDEMTDRCIHNLWVISRGLQAGREPDQALHCPITERPYQKSGQGQDVFYECPNPKAHGLTRLQVSKHQPIPELKK
jgi:hypothetical protein